MQKQIENDVTFPISTSGFSQRQFKIFYSISDGNYYLKDVSEGTGTFVRIDSKINIKDGNVFTFGNCHISVNYKSNEESDSEKEINVQVYEGNKMKNQM